MTVINVQKKLCLCCMEEHEVKTVTASETNIFKDVRVEYPARYFYCENADQFFSDENMITENDISMKNAYRKEVGLLTGNEIIDIRCRYGITQSDLCLLLGWGGKTVTRYESHQVQDVAHDTILRKLDEDPEWFLTLLEAVKDKLGKSSYEKYYDAASQLYALDRDEYLKKAIMARYAGFKNAFSLNGNTELSLEKVIDSIRYFANSEKVTTLYKVKLMKLLWYADALSFKRRSRTITGLVYQAMPMGAVPVAHDAIIDFSKINREEIEFGDGTGYHFLPTPNKEYPNLQDEDKKILDDIIGIFGSRSKDEIVRAMHGENAFIETAQHDMIQFKYAEALSIS